MLEIKVKNDLKKSFIWFLNIAILRLDMDRDCSKLPRNKNLT